MKQINHVQQSIPVTGRTTIFSYYPATTFPFDHEEQHIHFFY